MLGNFLDKLKQCEGHYFHKFVLVKHIRGTPVDPVDIFVCTRCGKRKIVRYHA